MKKKIVVLAAIFLFCHNAGASDANDAKVDQKVIVIPHPYAGPEGPPGPPGPQGLVGPQGLTGPQGVSGSTGPKGDTGDQGPQGSAGPIGPVGAKGDTGDQGPQGLIGSQGLTGPQGVPGSTGPKGDTGAQGPQGSTGPIGPVGAKGDTGDQGPQGLTGPPGVPGSTGPKGDTGAQGPQGPAGAGLTIVDSNSTFIGQVLSADMYGFSVSTSTGYIVAFSWDNGKYPSQSYWTGASCTGTAYLNDGGGGGGDVIYGKSAFWSGAANSYMVPYSIAANGTSVSESFTAATIENPDCSASAGARSGWRLETITNAELGLPVNMVLPFILQ